MLILLTSVKIHLKGFCPTASSSTDFYEKNSLPGTQVQWRASLGLFWCHRLILNPLGKMLSLHKITVLATSMTWRVLTSHSSENAFHSYCMEMFHAVPETLWAEVQGLHCAKATQKEYGGEEVLSCNNCIFLTLSKVSTKLKTRGKNNMQRYPWSFRPNTPNRTELFPASVLQNQTKTMYCMWDWVHHVNFFPLAYFKASEVSLISQINMYWVEEVCPSS